LKTSPHSAKSSRRNITLSWLAVIVWAGAIFYFSAQSNLSTGLGIWDLFLRKIAHMGEFGILSLLLWNALRLHGLAFTWTMALVAVVTFLYASSDEFHQSYVPGRNGSPVDVMIDFTGFIIAAAIIFGIRLKRTRWPRHR